MYSVSGEIVNKCVGLGLLSTVVSGPEAAVEIEAPAAAPTEEAPLVARATLPFLVCVTKSHGAASHRGPLSCEW